MADPDPYELHEAIRAAMSEEEERKPGGDYVDLSRRMSDVEDVSKKVYYAVFGLTNHNGLMGTTASLAEAVQALREDMNTGFAELKGETSVIKTDTQKTVNNLLLKVIAAIAFMLTLAVPVLIAVFSH